MDAVGGFIARISGSFDGYSIPSSNCGDEMLYRSFAKEAYIFKETYSSFDGYSIPSSNCGDEMLYRSFAKETYSSFDGFSIRSSNCCDEMLYRSFDDDDRLYHPSWRKNVVIAFGTLSSFLPSFT